MFGLAPISNDGGGDGGGGGVISGGSATPTYSSSGVVAGVAPGATAGSGSASVFGEGVYTPLDYPVMKPLGYGETLESADQVSDLKSQVSLQTVLLVVGLVLLARNLKW